MIYSKKSIITGSALTALALAFIIIERKSFLELGSQGKDYLFFMVIFALIGGAAIIIKPDKNSEGFKPSSYRLWVTFVFFLAPFIAIVSVERLNGNALSDLSNPFYISDNYFVALLFFMLIFALSGSVRISVFIGSPLFLLFGTANMYVKEFKGAPLLPMDAGTLATAANVAGGYDYSIGFELTYAIILTFMMVALACNLFMPERRKVRRFATGIAAFLVVGIASTLFYATDIPAKLNLRPDFFNQTRGYEARGAVLQFVYNTRFVFNTPPEDYDADEIEEIVTSFGDEVWEDTVPSILTGEAYTSGEEISGTSSTSTGKDTDNNTGEDTGNSDESSASSSDTSKSSSDALQYPDIIVVMDESFSDPSVIGDFETNEDYMPFIHGLEENTIKGNAYVSVRGTGTSNTEYEFLTGNSMAFLPSGSNAYQLYLKNKQPGLVSSLNALGYYCEASHPYFKDDWNRPEVYENMGFENFTALEDMFSASFGEDYLANGTNKYEFTNNVKEAYPDNLVLVKGYISDHFNYEKLIEMYEARDNSKPYFNFNITMQNHSPYSFSYDADFSQSICLEDLQGDYNYAEEYLSGIKASDDAFKELVTYFKDVKRPTIILFWGDHQPVLEDGFYEEISGKSLEQWSDEEEQSRYITPFVLWANYDIPEATIDKISVNYLQTLLLQTADMPLTDYEKYLARMYQKYPVITAAGCIDSEDNFFITDELTGGGGDVNKDAKSDLDDYDKVTYNNLTDTDNRIDKLFYLSL